MKKELIAPCGMNCAVCSAYLARENDLKKKGINRVYCEGCVPRGKNCLHMGDVCEKLGKGLVRFCYECEDFPCKRLKALDKRYRTKYRLSMIENLRYISEQGMESFLEKETEKWKCPHCGEGARCCHIGLCFSCQVDQFKQNRKYRWGER